MTFEGLKSNLHREADERWKTKVTNWKVETLRGFAQLLHGAEPMYRTHVNDGCRRAESIHALLCELEQALLTRLTEDVRSRYIEEFIARFSRAEMIIKELK